MAGLSATLLSSLGVNDFAVDPLAIWAADGPVDGVSKDNQPAHEYEIPDRHDRFPKYAIWYKAGGLNMFEGTLRVMKDDSAKFFPSGLDAAYVKDSQREVIAHVGTDLVFATIATSGRPIVMANEKPGALHPSARTDKN